MCAHEGRGFHSFRHFQTHYLLTTWNQLVMDTMILLFPVCAAPLCSLSLAPPPKKIQRTHFFPLSLSLLSKTLLPALFIIATYIQIHTDLHSPHFLTHTHTPETGGQIITHTHTRSLQPWGSPCCRNFVLPNRIHTTKQPRIVTI